MATYLLGEDNTPPADRSRRREQQVRSVVTSVFRDLDTGLRCKLSSPPGAKNTFI